MITPNQLKRELNKQKRKNEAHLIDIMFSLIDIEDVIQREENPIEEIKERIQRIKERIGRELSD
jgi:CII-binding regulator of phage lambda lysogenization HflD